MIRVEFCLAAIAGETVSSRFGSAVTTNSKVSVSVVNFDIGRGKGFRVRVVTYHK